MSILLTSTGVRLTSSFTNTASSLTYSDLPLPSNVLLVASAGTSTTSAVAYSVTNPDPTTPPIQDDHQWITAYLTIHQLSHPSYRYMYILWVAVVLISLVFAVLHWTGGRGGAIGGLWSKWSLRRRTWRKQHSLAKARREGTPYKQPLPLPSNAQLLSLAVLYIVTLILCFLGPDYIAPGTHAWDLGRNIAARGIYTHLDPREGLATTTSTFSQPGYTISKAWWTAGGRTGTIAFSLFPLCILFALKSPPFALFALPFLIQIYNDKLAFLHRWTGRLIWFVTTLHIALWGVQLSRDKRGADDPSSVWLFAFEYDKFVFGWLGFTCLTLLVVFSSRIFRNDFYEVFYILHIMLVPLTLTFSALHYPPIGWWCWAALALWAAERLWRLVRFLRINGVIGSAYTNRSMRYVALVHDKAFAGQFLTPGSQKEQRSYIPSGHHRAESVASQGSDRQLVLSTDADTMDVTDGRAFGTQGIPIRPRHFSTGQESFRSFATGSSRDLMMHVVPPGTVTSKPEFPPYGFGLGPASPPRAAFSSQVTASGYNTKARYIPPPGYAHGTLLPGRTIRLRLIPSRRFTWAPGQHVLLTIPSVSKFSSHPFTIASICDNEAVSDESREVLILVRARAGFTKQLWSYIEQLQDAGKIGDRPPYEFSPPREGVLLRAYLDGPFGSSIRARWTSYSTVLVIAGGSGVSFAVAVLEYACMCMTGRNGKMLGGMAGSWGHNAVSQISRVRFVWIVREFSHIQWVATVLRRCMDMVPTTALQVDIFVTNVVSRNVLAPSKLHSARGESGTLAPPTPHFAQSGRSRRNSNASDISMDSTISSNPFADVSYMRAPQRESGIGNEVLDIVDMYGELGHEEHVLDLTNFDGEDDTRLPGETQLSYRLRKEGKLRRAKTRKSQSALLPKLDPDYRTEAYSSSQEQKGRLVPEHEQLGFHPMSSPKDFVQPSGSESLQSPYLHSPLGPWSPAGNSPSPLTPQSCIPQSFLYADPGDASGSGPPSPSSKSDAFRLHDAKAKYASHHSRNPSKITNEAEAEDMTIVAERARPGKAKIDRIVADEAGRTRGAMVVACCGPTSLNAMVRKSVAAQINPSTIFRGDKQTGITLVSEDFEW